MFCPNCGTSAVSQQEFCASCGTGLTAQSQDASASNNPLPQPGVNLDEVNAPAPMNLVGTVKFSYKNYARFSGRGSRSEYWYWYLFNVLGFVAAYVYYFFETENLFMYKNSDKFLLLFLVFVLSTIIPGMARGVRRLHDTNKSGALLFLGLIPLVGPVLLLVFFCTDGDVVPNRYGPPNNRSPKI
jgi:uncharacterized membrane protein YhaH (DUF805 family)